MMLNDNKTQLTQYRQSFDFIDKFIEQPIEYQLLGAHVKGKSLHTPMHAHGGLYEFILCVNCKGYTKNKYGTFEVSPNSIIIHNANSSHEETFYVDEGNIELYYCEYVSFKSKTLDDLHLVNPNESPAISISLSLVNKIKTLFLNAVSELEQTRIGFSQIATNYLNTIFIMVIRHLKENNILLIPIDDNTVNYATDAKILIDKKITDQDFSLFSLSKELFISPAYLTKIFKTSFNTTPSDYIANKRIIKARKLLLTTSKTNEQISEEIGFKDVINFYRTFKKIVKISPTQYRKQTKIFTI